MLQAEHKQNLGEKEEALIFRDTNLSQKLEHIKLKTKHFKQMANTILPSQDECCYAVEPHLYDLHTITSLMVTDQYNFVDKVLIVKVECSFFNKDSIKLF